MALVAALAALVAALAAPSTATAHVTIAPPFVELGETTRLVFETPNERAPRATTSVELVVPQGVEIDAVTAPLGGWQLNRDGDTVRWSGGRIKGDDVVGFPLAVTVRTGLGTEVFRARQRYDDGAVVRWEARLTVVPADIRKAPDQQLGRAFAAGVVGLVVLVGSLVVLRRLRR